MLNEYDLPLVLAVVHGRGRLGVRAREGGWQPAEGRALEKEGRGEIGREPGVELGVSLKRSTRWS